MRYNPLRPECVFVRVRAAEDTAQLGGAVHVEYLREFSVFAYVLNYTKAAEQLCMSQPTLSRHIKALESELGFPLVANEGGELSVTPEGRLVLDSVLPFLRSLDRTIEECRCALRTKPQQIVVLDSAYHDDSFRFCLKRLEQFANEHHGTRIVRAAKTDISPLKAVAEGEIDWFFEFHSTDTAAVAEKYRKLGLSCVPLCDAEFQVWHAKDSDLSELPDDYVVQPNDILSRRIWSFYTAFSPARVAITELFEELGREPIFLNYVSRNADAFFLQPLAKNDLYLLPAGIEKNAPLGSRTDLMPAKRFARAFHVIGVRKTESANSLSDRLAEYLEA